MPTDDQLLGELDLLATKVVERDEDALTRVYELLAPTMLGLALGLLRNRAQAEDVVQDSFVRLVAAAPGLQTRDGRGLRSWLARTVRNRSVDILRSAAHRREFATETLPDIADTDEEADVLVPTDPVVVSALEALTEDQRHAVLLFHVAGLRGQEVGQVLGRNRAAVYALLRRAERTMREALARTSEDATPFDRDDVDRPDGRRAT